MFFCVNCHLISKLQANRFPTRWYITKKRKPNWTSFFSFLRKVRDSNPRYHEMGIPDFESSAFGHSANLPKTGINKLPIFIIATAKVIIISEIMKRYSIFFWLYKSTEVGTPIHYIPRDGHSDLPTHGNRQEPDICSLFGRSFPHMAVWRFSRFVVPSDTENCSNRIS